MNEKSNRDVQGDNYILLS